MPARVILQNQTFDIPDDLVALNAAVVAEKGDEAAKTQRDTSLKRWLSQVSPAATNATLTWSQEDGPNDTKTTVVRVTPQLGTKGSEITDALVLTLLAVPASVHPMVSLAFELRVLSGGQFTNTDILPRLLAYKPRIIEALEHSESGDRIIGEIAQNLRDARATPSPWAPIGF